MYSLPLSCGCRSLQAPSQFLPFLPLDLPILGPMAGGMNAESCGPQFNLELSREEVSLLVDNWSQLLKAAAGSVKVGPSLTRLCLFGHTQVGCGRGPVQTDPSLRTLLGTCLFIWL